MASEQLSPAKAELPQATTTIVPTDPEQSSPTTEASPDKEYSKYDDPNYVSPKWPKSRPTEYKPYLVKFTVFLKLPIEIRQAIWNHTLAPRVVEIDYSLDRGFFSKVKIPIALKVNKDSRNAVGHLYPVCFGNVLHQPSIRFNFSIDTLYFDADLGPEVLQFVVSLKESELKKIRYIAIDRDINDYVEFGDYIENSFDSMTCLQKAVDAMPAIQETLVVFKLNEYWHDHGFPEGVGQIELMDSFSYGLQQYMYHECFHLDDEDAESECQELPEHKHLLARFEVPKKGSIWGWRPIELPLKPYPWEDCEGARL
jgi:hypothetical protein